MVITDLLTRVLSEISEQGLEYALLRNYDFLLENTPCPHKDADILIRRKDEKNIEQILLGNGFTRQTPPGARWIIRYKADPDGASRPILFDLHLGGISCLTIYYISAAEALKDAINVKHIRVISPVHKWINLVVHSILCKRYFKPKYIKEMRDLESSGKFDWNEAEDILSRTFGRRSARRLQAYEKSSNWDALLKFRWNLILAAALRSASNARAALAEIKRVIRLSLKRVKSSKTRLITIIGVDGAGKTTLAEGIRSTMEKSQRKCRIVYMGRGKMRALPGGRAMAKSVGIELPAGEEIVQESSLSYSILRSARDVTYLLDSYARYVRYLLPHRLRGETIVTDRYAYDVLLNEKTARWVRWVILHLYPPPDVLVYLHHDPFVIHERKPQYTPERLAHDMKKLDQVVNQVESSGRSLVLRITPLEPETTLSETLRYVH